MSAWAVLVAAGRGERFGAGRNKVYLPLAGKSVLQRSLNALENSAALDGIAIVYAPGEEEMAREVRCSLPVLFVMGGQRRQDSVYNGLCALPEDADVVAIHDGARPLVKPELVARCIDMAREFGSGVAASETRDTVKRVDADGAVVETPDRTALRSAKTPQCFRMPALKKYYERALSEGWEVTDDAQIVEKCGGRALLVPCGEDNIKITAPEDIRIAEAILGARKETRVGLGYDVHALVSGRKLILCGVEIPHETGLDGHSDADVATHALIDAILGACALGDIGMLFPDSDPQYAGADSMELLREVMRVAAEAGCSIGNVDITVIAQRPKLAPYRDAMRERLADAMQVDISRVSVKMKTTERLGFAGREEGIAAHAAVMMVCF